MNSIHKEISKNFSNNGKETKFVIVFYEDFLSEKTYKDLEKSGIKTIILEDYIKDINTLKYKRSKSDHHPNKQAWKVIAPVIQKKLLL